MRANPSNGRPLGNRPEGPWITEGFKDAGNLTSADSPPREHDISVLAGGASNCPAYVQRAYSIGVYPPGRVPPAEREHVVSSEHQRAALPRPSYGQAL